MPDQSSYDQPAGPTRMMEGFRFIFAFSSPLHYSPPRRFVKRVSTVGVRAAAAERGQTLRHLLEGSILIAGGVCVLSVAVQQLYCWRTHRKGGGLL